jgi:hypothetical protein
MPETKVTVKIENLAPENGTFLTPFWVGFHRGSFDTFDRRRPVSPGLEALAEDGDTSKLSAEFALSGYGSVDGTIAGTEGVVPEPIDPGEVATATFTLDSDDPESHYFNYASMVIPSNDAFIANSNPHSIEIFDENGNFVGADFVVYGSEVLDAGTEVNDELEDSTAFFGQKEPNIGTDENGVVRTHSGFIEGGRILSEDGSSEDSAAAFTNADFKADGYQIARISVIEEEVIPESDSDVAGIAIEKSSTESESMTVETPDMIEVTVTVTNLAPEYGTTLSPLWAGFHDGSFDIYDRSQAASAALESLAEDGNVDGLSSDFMESNAGSVDAVIKGAEGDHDGPIDVGETTSYTFTIDPSLANSRFFSYASMILPSNDAFIANGNQQAFEIFDEHGNFYGADFVVSGNRVLDAGTEINDEARNTTPFLEQTVPNSGTVENGVVGKHQGFLAGGEILTTPEFVNADFTADNYDLARITVTTEDVPTVPLGVNPEYEGLVDLTRAGEHPVTLTVSNLRGDGLAHDVVGFYTIEDAQGTVKDESGNYLMPGDKGYVAAAIEASVVEIDRANRDPQTLMGGDLLAPYIIAHGSTDELLSENYNNSSTKDPLAYFAFSEANPDGIDHIQSQGDNSFYFEDFFGGGNRDFDDVAFNADFSI